MLFRKPGVISEVREEEDVIWIDGRTSRSLGVLNWFTTRPNIYHIFVNTDILLSIMFVLSSSEAFWEILMIRPGFRTYISAVLCWPMGSSNPQWKRQSILYNNIWRYHRQSDSVYNVCHLPELTKFRFAVHGYRRIVPTIPMRLLTYQWARHHFCLIRLSTRLIECPNLPSVGWCLIVLE
jgi:hypothetical protein